MYLSILRKKIPKVRNEVMNQFSMTAENIMSKSLKCEEAIEAIKSLFIFIFAEKDT